MEWHDETGSQMDLANYRLEQAQTDIRSAKALSDMSDYIGANNRAYYAIFHSISALYALEGKAYKRHKDALAQIETAEMLITQVKKYIYGI